MAELALKPRLFIVFFLLGISVLFAQNHDDLYLLYDNHKIDQLDARLTELEKRNLSDPEITFFRATFLESGEEALVIYLDLFDKSSGRLKNLIAARLSAYYFAQGYYVKAQEYEKLASVNFPVATQVYTKPADNSRTTEDNQIPQPVYIIQVGAFGVKENAEELSEVLVKKKIDSRVVTRQIGDKELFCVWIDGAADYDATKEVAEDIKLKYKLTYRILKP